MYSGLIFLVHKLVKYQRYSVSQIQKGEKCDGKIVLFPKPQKAPENDAGSIHQRNPNANPRTSVYTSR
jgi:hypothetical protein